jgi:adenosylcobinamide kinase/adenosylcobinamide-phosphate guanylyltransferase
MNTNLEQSITLIIGGARSGKSRFAEKLALEWSKDPVYVATSRIWDEDHRARIERHRLDRGPEWQTMEEEKNLSQIGVTGRVVVVDCVTLWLTNFFVDSKQDHEVALPAIRNEFDRTAKLKNHFIFVTNEIGQGVHAHTESGRKFTDVQGFINQHIAARANRVVLMVAGIPVNVKNEGASS